MLQTVDGREVFVVEFDTIPELPIIWNTVEEKPYAEALEDAIQTDVITKPGKYGIQVNRTSKFTTYTIHAIKE